MVFIKNKLYYNLIALLLVFAFCSCDIIRKLKLNSNPCFS